MKKIPTVFERDWTGDRSRVLNQVHPGCEWVLAGEGVATRKLDGTACLIRGGRLFKRREVKSDKAPPPGFEAVERDETTGKLVGWVPVGEWPEDKYHREARALLPMIPEDGTYELLGPKVQGNPENKLVHVLISHRVTGVLLVAPRTFEGLAAWLATQDIEGVVFHHHDGRMAKVKLRDFGLKRGSAR